MDIETFLVKAKELADERQIVKQKIKEWGERDELLGRAQKNLIEEFEKTNPEKADKFLTSVFLRGVIFYSSKEDKFFGLVNNGKYTEGGKLLSFTPLEVVGLK